MIRELLELANALGVSEGGLLKLAREISHDGALVSIAHMRSLDRKILHDFLTRALAHQRQPELVA